jgi:hypothetical protein
MTSLSASVKGVIADKLVLKEEADFILNWFTANPETPQLRWIR